MSEAFDGIPGCLIADAAKLQDHGLRHNCATVVFIVPLEEGCFPVTMVPSQVDGSGEKALIELLHLKSGEILKGETSSIEVDLRLKPLMGGEIKA